MYFRKPSTQADLMWWQKARLMCTRNAEFFRLSGKVRTDLKGLQVLKSENRCTRMREHHRRISKSNGEDDWQKSCVEESSYLIREADKSIISSTVRYQYKCASEVILMLG